MAETIGCSCCSRITWKLLPTVVPIWKQSLKSDSALKEADFGTRKKNVKRKNPEMENHLHKNKDSDFVSMIIR